MFGPYSVASDDAMRVRGMELAISDENPIPECRTSKTFMESIQSYLEFREAFFLRRDGHLFMRVTGC